MATVILSLPLFERGILFSSGHMIQWLETPISCVTKCLNVSMYLHIRYFANSGLAGES